MAASFEMKITKNGSTLVELTDNAKYLIDQPYHMKAKAPDVPVTRESLNLVVLGADYAAARGNLNDLVDALQQAQNFWDHPGYGDEPVYLEVKIESSDDWYRSLLHPESEVTDIDIDVANLNAKIPCKLHIVRHNFWEGDEVTLSLANSNTPNEYVFLSNDGSTVTPPVGDAQTAENWLTYSPQSGFDLPSPLQLTIAPINPDFFPYMQADKILICNYRINKAAETNFNFYFEAEDGSGHGANTADTTCSNGNKRVFTLSTDSVQTLTIGINTARPDIWQNRVLIPVIRFSSTNDLGDIVIRVRIEGPAGNIVVGEWQTLAPTYMVQKLNGLQFFPAPVAIYSSSFALFKLEIDLKRTTSSTETVGIDYIQVLFAESTLVLDAGLTGSIGADKVLYVTPYDQFVESYMLSNMTYAGNWIIEGTEPIYIYPDEYGYLVFCWLMDGAIYGGFDEGAYIISSAYRPRRLTL
jgi:hypothetical protein